jgi:hypothetical protein
MRRPRLGDAAGAQPGALRLFSRGAPRCGERRPKTWHTALVQPCPSLWP